ncbi:MAG: AI-2E family transporter, partial [Verrucomicrobiales bacterium]
LLSLPLTSTLKKCRVPWPLAVLLTVAIDVLIVGGIVYISSGFIPEFQAKVPEYISKLQERGLEAALWLEGRAGLTDAEEAYRNLFDWPAMVELVRQTEVIQRLASLFSKTFFVLVVMIFILTESGRFAEKISDIRGSNGPDLRRFENASRDIQRYLGIKTLISAVTGTLAGVLTWSFGLDFFLLWGLVAFIFNYIPVVGSIFAAIPAVFIALVQFGPLTSLGVMIGFLLINIILGNFIEPLLLGRRFGISTVVVILSVLFWGYVWGPVGMFLAVPLTMVVKVMLDNTEDFRWVSIAMGKAPPRVMISIAESEARALEGTDNEIAGA